ncbi:hypothetical protein HMI56_005282 [Coelomomyces lativittatus]|nr:hypothetical protein HMI56_005282 [Coelomomyces lativittatus]
MFLKPKQWNKQDLELTVKLLFEELQISGLTMVESAVAALLGTNVVTGLVIEMGYDVTDIVPIHDTIPQTYASRSMHLGRAAFENDPTTFLEHLESLLSSSIQALDPILKSTVLENIVLANDALPFKDKIAPLIHGWMADAQLQDQPREWKFKEIPEYLEAFHGKPEYNAYLGASLLAKLIFPDSKSFVSKEEYLQSGPSIIHKKSYGGISV